MNAVGVRVPKKQEREFSGRAMRSPASHRVGPGSFPGQSVWDLWWTKWRWDRFLSVFFGFPLSIPFRRRSQNSQHLGNA
jgi:hypothetical protein